MWCSLWSTVINCCTLRDVSSTISTARGLSTFPCSCMLSNWICPFFPKKVWDEGQIKFGSEENDEKSSSSVHMDVICGCLSSLKLGNGTHKFGRISDVAKHSYSTTFKDRWRESFFSYKEKQNNISARLQVYGTLASLLTIKMTKKESSFEQPADLFARTKKATWNYNKEHQWSEWKHVEETPVF